MLQRWRLRVVVLLGLLSLASNAAAQTQQARNIGQVTALEGRVTVLRQGRFATALLTVRASIFQEDIVETERASKVKITLADATVLSLGEQSRLELAQFSHDLQLGRRSGRLAVVRGLFRAVLKELTSFSNVELVTPTAVAAIRGTDFMAEVSADSTAIVVLDGRVTISNVRSIIDGLTTPTATILTAGMGTTIKADEPPTAPIKWSEARIEALRKATALP
jgi:ferric-dicitrate binding protein FerR (iron transport regulator)